jgi:hypothetical protein
MVLAFRDNQEPLVERTRPPKNTRSSHLCRLVTADYGKAPVARFPFALILPFIASDPPNAAANVEP